ncbi:beta-glucanase (GH16 family) [Kribbella aluminosa]|uniref:Beta-glucanase (GH16 family) n=1 Tax=Kribbella aluminosa TaxID=416017 RepID=A0ABS4UJK4_9ACTN|nr:family 16 glycosylhydrolase [Kribbella aluminosa]MBP2351780.1 beta-glucanase (GH16 family) [Kribbella aluminosa]
MRARAFGLVIAVAALVVPVVSASAAHPPEAGGSHGNGLPSAPNGFTTVFADDFSGPRGRSVDRSDWRFDIGNQGGYGNGEAEFYTDSTSNVGLDGHGNLEITPIRTPAGEWTSGRIQTNRSDFTAGAHGILRVQASIRLPQVGSGVGATGIWPAFWMLGSPLRSGGTWPDAGEIDIMENVNGRPELSQTFHCGIIPGGPCDESNGRGHGTPAPDLQQSYHTYAMELDRSITPNQIRWYLDGRLTFTLSQQDLQWNGSDQLWQDGTNHGFYLLLNVAVGGAFPWAECNFFPHPGGCSFSTPFPQMDTSKTVSGKPMSVAYVAVYQKR